MMPVTDKPPVSSVAPADLKIVRCWNCGRSIHEIDNYCRHCGKSRKVPWYYGHAGIILLTLFCLGPFSLWFVWKSPIISGKAKWAYTIVILGFTIYIAIGVYNIFMAGFNLLTGGALEAITSAP
jgi:heme A synthase